ncbi:MAG: FAD binding domain-containing protein [Clostridiaceae bacterium]
MVKAYRPTSLDEALDILDKEPLYILAGGTDLMVKKRRWTGITPSFDKNVLFVSDINELNKIEVNDKYIIIGCAATCTEISEDTSLPYYIRDVFRNMASPGIRNLATIGGNIGNSSPAGDSLPILYAMDAELVLAEKNSRRIVPIIDFITGPGKNIRKDNEIIKEIRIPKVNYNKIMIKKVGTRLSTALSKLSFAGLAVLENNKITDFRASFGAVGPKIVRNIESERKVIDLINNNFNEESIRKLYSCLITPIDDQRSTAAYRKETSLRLLLEFVRTLREGK